MTPDAYEQADDEELTEGGRSRFDVVILDGHSTQRLPAGAYFFFGAAPLLDGFGIGEIGNPDPEYPDWVFNWDDGHPIMRYVNPLNVEIWRWRRLELPDNAVSLMDAHGGTVLAEVSHKQNRFLICAFGLL